jgi:hypothetical protein
MAPSVGESRCGRSPEFEPGKDVASQKLVTVGAEISTWRVVAGTLGRKCGCSGWRQYPSRGGIAAVVYHCRGRRFSIAAPSALSKSTIWRHACAACSRHVVDRVWWMCSRRVPAMIGLRDWSRSLPNSGLTHSCCYLFFQAQQRHEAANLCAVAAHTAQEPQRLQGITQTVAQLLLAQQEPQRH